MAGGCGGARTPAAQAPAPVARSAPAALGACLAVLDATPEDGGEAAVQTILNACAPVWSEPRCRDAWTNSLDKLAGLRASWIMTECAGAYCPEAGSSLCTMDTASADLTDTEVDWMGAWVEFNETILSPEPDGETSVDAGYFARSLLLMISMTSVRRHVD